MKIRFLTLALILFFSSCDFVQNIIDEGSFTTFDLSKILVTESDGYGNLMIINNNNKRFYLYVNDSIYRLIPANTDEFFVKINAKKGQSTNLKLYVATDLSESELYDPPESKIYVQWQVILPELQDNYYSQTEYVTWDIPDSPGENTKATIVFSYPDVDYQGNEVKENVDIFLNSTTGAKLMSLAPGDEVETQIEYGYQILYFRYWESDPNSPDGQNLIGWVEKKPNGTNYSLVLNYANQNLVFDVPVYFEQYPDNYGFLQIINTTDNTLFIKANDQPLEDFIVVPSGESTQGLSYVEAQKIITYKVPVGDYYLRATIPESGSTVTSSQLTVTANDTLQFQINK